LQVTGGKDFGVGQNSHDGTVFRRHADQLPRGNMILHAKCVFHDTRKALYDRQVEIAERGSHGNVLKLLDYLANRIHGTPTKHVEKTMRREPNFYLMTGDGQKQPLFPERQAVGAGSTPAATSAEDELILGPCGCDEDERHHPAERLSSVGAALRREPGTGRHPEPLRRGDGVHPRGPVQALHQDKRGVSYLMPISLSLGVRAAGENQQGVSARARIRMAPPP
jgi:hypothetical protein